MTIRPRHFPRKTNSTIVHAQTYSNGTHGATKREEYGIFSPDLMDFFLSSFSNRMSSSTESSLTIYELQSLVFPHISFFYFLGMGVFRNVRTRAMGTRDRDKTNNAAAFCTCTDKIDGMLRCTAMAKIFWEST